MEKPRGEREAYPCPVVSESVVRYCVIPKNPGPTLVEFLSASKTNGVIVVRAFTVHPDRRCPHPGCAEDWATIPYEPNQ